MRRFLFLVLALSLCACTQKTTMVGGYHAGLVPGITLEQAEAIMGKPAAEENFALPGISAVVISYPFGELLVQHDKVVAVTVASDPDFVGPLGMKVGTSEDDLRKALLTAPRPHSSYRLSYQVETADSETRTRDVYDDANSMMVELAAANPNDSEAPFSVVSISLTNAAGSALLSSITKAKVQGLYPGQNIVNFVSEPWPEPKQR